MELQIKKGDAAYVLTTHCLLNGEVTEYNDSEGVLTVKWALKDIDCPQNQLDLGAELVRSLYGHQYHPKITPAEYIHSNGIKYIEGKIIEYVSKHGSCGKGEDIEKALAHCVTLLRLEYEYTTEQILTIINGGKGL